MGADVAQSSEPIDAEGSKSKKRWAIKLDVGEFENWAQNLVGEVTTAWEEWAEVQGASPSCIATIRRWIQKNGLRGAPPVEKNCMKLWQLFRKFLLSDGEGSTPEDVVEQKGEER
jgi:hypothetical protein